MLDESGARTVPGARVLLLARRGGSELHAPVATFKTDSNGYFTIAYPAGEWAHAHARVESASLPTAITFTGLALIASR